MRIPRTSQVFCALLVAGFIPGAMPALAQSSGEIVTTPLEAVPQISPAARAVAEEPALPAAAAAFRTAIRAEIADLPEAQKSAIDQFYAGRGYEPYWTEPGQNNVEVLIAALEAAPDQGLPLRRYDPGALAVIFESDPADTPPALREVAATRTYLRYGGDLTGGLVTPSSVDAEINVKPDRMSPTLLLTQLDTAPLGEVLAGLEPRGAEYPALIAEKARLEALSMSDAWGPEVAAGPTLREGETGPRIAALRGRLARLGYAAPTGEMVGEEFDASLAAAVESFQRDRGLNADGVVGQHTLSEINMSPEDLLRQVLVNLERLRWQSQDFGPRYIIVNIPDYTTTVYEDGTQVWQSRVVVGEADKTRTPEFSDVMSYIVINPSWHVPSSIAKRVYLPKLQRDPGVLARSGMELLTPSGTVINPALVDFNALNGTFPFRIRQSPSDSNALGKVKFIFPNEFAIYLHDTPHRELFARDARAFSNGCIRVQDPDALAHLLLSGQVSDPVGAFDGWVAAKSEKTVMLDAPIPVHLVYRTAFVGQDGIVRFRDDIYGRDKEVFRALEEAGVTLPAAQG